jgi:ribonuclease HI
MKPKEGIAVDGGCSGNPGRAYYRAVDIATGKELFREEIGVATNNIAEFLGLCHAIHYVNTNKIKHPIYTDSRTAMSWVKNKKANSSFSENVIDERLRKAETFLRILNFSNIRKWETKLWGEVPADFGLK